MWPHLSVKGQALTRVTCSMTNSMLAVHIHYSELVAGECVKAGVAQINLVSQIADICCSYFMNKGSASQLTVFLAWDSNPCLLAAPAQLMRSGITRKTHCTIDNWVLSKHFRTAASKETFSSACVVHLRTCLSWWLSGVHKSVVRTLVAEAGGGGWI